MPEQKTFDLAMQALVKVTIEEAKAFIYGISNRISCTPYCSSRGHPMLNEGLCDTCGAQEALKRIEEMEAAIADLRTVLTIE